MTDIWLDRRIEIGSETAESLAKCYNRDNWRGHPEVQRESTQESLEALGWIGSVKKNTRTGRLFDGHLRVELALLKDPQSRVPVDYYDLSEEEEALALQILDATTEMAEPIPEKLAALMEKTRTMVAGRPGLSAMLARLKEKAEQFRPFNPDSIEFKEYDESVADEVEYIECPNCGHQIPK